ncbi:MAG: SCO family protein [Flavobacteriia bacterium]|nr:SCO family protein [Flavobacteriia bacterium]
MKSFFILAGILLVIACHSEKKKQRVLPIIGNYDIEYRQVNGVEVADTVYPKMVAFSYLNQDSIKISSKDMKGKIWIAEFFFTSCPTICPPMTRQMIRLNKNTKDLEKYLQFISFSINPTHDTPSELKKYIHKHHIKAKNWQFFTGDEAKTHELGINNFQIFAGQDPASAGGYAHSGAFTLVDREGYVRGVYLGTDPKEVNKLEKDLRKLLKYEYEVN